MLAPPKIFSLEDDLYFPIGIVKMRKDVSFWRFNRLKFEKLYMRNEPYCQDIPKFFAQGLLILEKLLNL